MLLQVALAAQVPPQMLEQINSPAATTQPAVVVIAPATTPGE